MSDPRWTDETQDLVADLLYRGRDGDGHVDAVRVLSALADADLLAMPEPSVCRCGVNLTEVPNHCDHCHDDPPRGHRCRRCGRAATT